MYAFNSAAMFYPGNPYIEGTTVLSDYYYVNTVDVFDSMLSVSSKVLEKQVAAVARCREQELTICYIDVQQQEGGDDCGLFAVAFARH